MKNGLCLGILVFAMSQIGQGSYIFVKAKVAQWLIEDAWQESIVSQHPQPPWSWADTWPVAKLTLADEVIYVLQGASLRTLAFGPGHLNQTPQPGNLGNSVILGHRDTHFAALSDLKIDDQFSLTNMEKEHYFRVDEIRIVHKDYLTLPDDTHQRRITFITCYPFDAITSQTPFRYVVISSELPPGLSPELPVQQNKT